MIIIVSALIGGMASAAEVFRVRNPEHAKQARGFFSTAVAVGIVVQLLVQWRLDDQTTKTIAGIAFIMTGVVGVLVTEFGVVKAPTNESSGAGDPPPAAPPPAAPGIGHDPWESNEGRPAMGRPSSWIVD